MYGSKNTGENWYMINSKNNISQEYIPLHYLILKTFIITNPCNTDKSILIRNNTFYKYDREQQQWKRLCVSRNIFDKEIPIVNSIAHLNNDLILIIHGILFRTQDIISSSKNPDIIYRLLRYSNLPILFDKIDYVFTTPCCTCLKTINYYSISHIFNDYIILANKFGNVILFYLKSLTIIYNFGNIFQSQTICKSNQCTILYLGLSHSIPLLICIIKYQNEKAIIFHQTFLELNSIFQKSTFINFTGNNLYITPSTFHNAYFIWDENKIYYTINDGLILSDITTNGCQFDYLNNMNENQLKNYYTNLNVDYDNITLITKDIYCLNITIDYIFISNNEFFIITKNNEWLYGKESFLPSMINLKQYKECNLIIQNIYIPQIDLNINQCLLNINKKLLSCTMFSQSLCSYIYFKPLFDINKIYILEKNNQKYFQFILEAYTIIPIMIVSTQSILLDYSINYTINRLNTGIVQIIGNILVSTTNQINNDLYDSSLISIRLDLLQYSYSCNQPSSFLFQVEASCSSASTLHIEKNIEFEFWNESNPIIDIEWIRKNLPINTIHQFSSVYIKRKQNYPILLKYQYCFNQTCQLINDDQIDFLIIYAIPLNKEHEIYARYLINRSDSCIPISQSIYRLWLKWTLNTTARNQFFQIPYERRTFYQTLLNTFVISTNSCLFFNGSLPIYINESINQASDNYLKFILHIIAYNNKFSFCDLETFLLIEIGPIHNIHNSYHGWIFFITLFIFLIFFILFINIYTYYKQQQRKKYLEYHRLNQIDAGQFHQWYDIAQYLNINKHTNNYDVMCNYLRNLESTTNLTKHLMEYHT
ncbi:unnamed protein product [Rotaria sordida]|uniref:Uncharacterized protein n=1 Tax=Rotaria sordida TaxID=392033 RepID=A0A819DHC7_9BILA|nr:unnamed protein product [Rotaria sordida]